MNVNELIDAAIAREVIRRYPADKGGPTCAGG